MEITTDVLLKGPVWAETIEGLSNVFNYKNRVNYNIFVICIALGIMYDKVIEIYDKALDVFANKNVGKISKVNELEDVIDDMKVSCQKGHVKRMANGKCSIEAGLIFTDLVIGLERIADHCVNIAQSILPENTKIQ